MASPAQSVCTWLFRTILESKAPRRGGQAQPSFTLQQCLWSEGYAMNNQNEPQCIHPSQNHFHIYIFTMLRGGQGGRLQSPAQGMGEGGGGRFGVGWVMDEKPLNWRCDPPRKAKVMKRALHGSTLICCRSAAGISPATEWSMDCTFEGSDLEFGPREVSPTPCPMGDTPSTPHHAHHPCGTTL